MEHCAKMPELRERVAALELKAIQLSSLQFVLMCLD